jgi:hypothetical protein
MSLGTLLEWLDATPGSVALHESRYLFLVILTLHVLTLPLSVGTAVMMDLRLLGVTMGRVPTSEVFSRLVPWARAGFVVLVTTGVLLFYASPVDRYENPFFRIKIVMLVLAGVNALVFSKTAYRRIVEWDRDPVPPLAVQMVGGIALGLWIAIILAGRMMAYAQYWFG